MSEQTLISIVDDDESLCAAVSGLLRSYGYETRSFASAEAFLASDGVVDSRCVITDIHMPGMSGIELKQALVARQCEVPVIMITARKDPGVESRALASGAVCLLKKPFECDALMECVSRALGS